MDENEARSVEPEARINGSTEPVLGIDNTWNTQRQHEKADGSDEENTRDHRIGGGHGAEEEKVDSDDDGEEIQEEENDRVALDGVGGQRERVQRRLAEDGEEGGDGSEKRNESVEKEVNRRRRRINGVSGESVESGTDAIEAHGER